MDIKNNIKKFNSNEKARRYIKELGFNLKDCHCFKEDKSFLYTKKFSKQQVYLRSTYDFFSANSMEMGTVWTVQQF
jgi:hypothetical protein